VRPARIAHFGRAFIVFDLKRNIRKATQLFLQTGKLLWKSDSGQDFLSDGAQETYSSFGYDFFKLAELIYLAGRKIMPSAAKGQRPDRGIHQHHHVRFRRRSAL
jgi:hypothetical protein